MLKERKKRKSAARYDASLPPHFTGSRSSASVCLCPKRGRHLVLLVTLSHDTAFPSASVTGVNDHVKCCHSSRAAECCSRRSMPRQGFSLCISLSLSHTATEHASEAGSRRVSTPTIWLKHFQPNPPPLHPESQPLPAHQLVARPCPPEQLRPMEGPPL